MCFDLEGLICFGFDFYSILSDVPVISSIDFSQLFFFMRVEYFGAISFRMSFFFSWIARYKGESFSLFFTEASPPYFSKACTISIWSLTTAKWYGVLPSLSWQFIYYYLFFFLNILHIVITLATLFAKRAKCKGEAWSTELLWAAN